MIFIEQDKLQKVIDRLSEIEITVKTKSEYAIDSKTVPRVTEILSSMLSEPGLMNWANSLGWKRISYSKFMREAADKGTYSHLAVEKYIRNGYVNIDEFQIMDYKIRNTVESTLSGFRQWWEELNTFHKVEVVFLEETLLCKYFGGTCDCLLKVDDQYWLIDFKTSNHMSYNYALQLSAYRYLLKELKNIDVDRCMVLKLDKENYSYQTYELYMDNSEHLEFMNNCLQTFMVLSVAYRMRLSTIEEYKKIFNI